MTTLGEEDVLLAAHGTYADGRTIPLVLMQNEERRYLGKPFTPCADGYVNVSRGKQYDNVRFLINRKSIISFRYIIKDYFLILIFS